ncbi:MAG: helix-turn-helix domain-containing protein [Actinomycetota bacterium]|nr:helix-turn-helix domain-containing protein [Actinomycetota bacterium]
MAKQSTPVHIQSAKEDDPTARALGLDVAGILRYQADVLDREDRLESGTGRWRESFQTDQTARHLAAKESVLRTIQIASNPECFRIIEALHTSENLTSSELVEITGLGRLTLQERIGDLVSAGLVSKIPEADQIVITAGGHAIAELVRRAAAVTAHDLASKR